VDRAGQFKQLAERAAQPGADGTVAFKDLCNVAATDWNDFVAAVGNLAGRPADVVARVIAFQGQAVLPKLTVAVREAQVAVPIATAAVIQLGADSLRQVVPLSGDPSASVRTWVAASLGGFPKQAKSHLPVLAAFVADPDERVAIQALETIRPLGTEARSIAGVVQAATADTRERVRAAALVTLPALSEGSEELSAKLVKEATDPTAPRTARLAAIESLGRTRASPETLAALLTVAGDPDLALRSSALDSLIKLRGAVGPVAPQILKMLETGPSPDAGRLLLILASVDLPRGAEEVVAKYCASRRTVERAAALTCLLRVPQPTDSTIRAVIERLKDADTGVRMKAVQVLLPHARKKDVNAALVELREREQNPQVRNLLTSLENKGAVLP
jgi:HEAT repeat protein